MALILNIESATSVCSVALGQDGALIHQEISRETYQHASQITLLIEACLSATQLSFQDLDAVAVSKGPGSYTALRVGMSTAKGICFSLNKPLIGLSTLKILAQGLLLKLSVKEKKQHPLLCPMIDARRMEVYTNLFDLDLVAQGDDEARIIDEKSYQDFFLSGQNIIFTGDGSKKIQTLIKDEHAVFYPSEALAQDMVPLAEQAYADKVFLDISYAEPFYLKPPNITTPQKLL